MSCGGCGRQFSGHHSLHIHYVTSSTCPNRLHSEQVGSAMYETPSGSNVDYFFGEQDSPSPDDSPLNPALRAGRTIDWDTETLTESVTNQTPYFGSHTSYLNGPQCSPNFGDSPLHPAMRANRNVDERSEMTISMPSGPVIPCIRCRSTFYSGEAFDAHLEMCDGGSPVQARPPSNSPALRNLSNVSECPVCFQQSAYLTSGPCGHVFCTQCFWNAMGTRRKSGPCPMCHRKTRLRDLHPVCL